MNNEPIKKAYEQFNGVWPYSNTDNMIISHSSGVYFYEAFHCSEDEFYSQMKDTDSSWICNKDQFEEFSEKLTQTPIQNTHSADVDSKNPFTNEWEAYNYKTNRMVKCLCIGGDPRSRQSAWKMFSEITTSTPFFSDRYKTKGDCIDRTSDEEAWMPDVWQMCEYESGETESGWDVCTLEGSTRVGNVISSARYSTGKLISKEVKFRPIKTEREKFIEKCASIKKPHMWTEDEFLGAIFDSGARFND